MNSSSGISIKIVRLVAAGFILIGLMNLALYFFKSHHQQTDISALRCLYLSIPLVVGVVILIKGSALAGWIDDFLEQ